MTIDETAANRTLLFLSTGADGVVMGTRVSIHMQQLSSRII